MEDHGNSGSVSVRYFAAARDLAGVSEEKVPCAEPQTVERFMERLAARHPALGAHVSKMRLAVDGEVRERSYVIEAGSELAVLPPVAGGSSAPAICHGPLSIDQTIARVARGGAGGIAVFLGVVRDTNRGIDVARLEYEAWEDKAEATMRAIVAEVEEEIPETRVAAVHRVGSLGVGEIAVIVAASAPHRTEAFAACRKAIDRIKERAPIWKREWGVDGTSEWVNLCGCEDAG